LTGLTVGEKLQLESEGEGEDKAYKAEAKRLLDSVIKQNKDEKAVSPLPMVLTIVECHCRTCSGSLSRSSSTYGTLIFRSLIRSKYTPPIP
jgi:hypothetical protein